MTRELEPKITTQHGTAVAKASAPSDQTQKPSQSGRHRKHRKGYKWIKSYLPTGAGHFQRLIISIAPAGYTVSLILLTVGEPAT